MGSTTLWNGIFAAMPPLIAVANIDRGHGHMICSGLDTPCMPVIFRRILQDFSCLNATIGQSITARLPTETVIMLGGKR